MSGVRGGVCVRVGVSVTEIEAAAAGELALANVDARRDPPPPPAADDAAEDPLGPPVGVFTPPFPRAIAATAISARSEASARADECAFLTGGVTTLLVTPAAFVDFCRLARRRAPDPLDTAMGGVDRSADARDEPADDDAGVLLVDGGGGGGAASVTPVTPGIGDAAADAPPGGDPFLAEKRA